MGYKFNEINSALKNDVTIQNILSSQQFFQFSREGAKQNSLITIILHSLKSYIRKTLLNHETISHQQKPTTDKITHGKQEMDTTEKENLISVDDRSDRNRFSSENGIRTKTSTKNVRNSTLACTSSSSNNSNSHYLVRQSIRFYAASSVILALCYLTTPISASIDSASHPV